MSHYRRFLFPLLARTDAETAHERTLALLAWAQKRRSGRTVLRALAGRIPEQPVHVFGLTFPNVLGVAAGFDKNVEVATGLGLLGFGHVEVGTLTPRAQAGNPRPRIFRLLEDDAIINRMGFPNEGVDAAVPRLRRLARQERSHVLGVSLGKQKDTDLADAEIDYLTVMTAVYRFADYLAINISSPNTPGLRALQGGNYLGYLLRVLVAENERLGRKHGLAPRPLLVKIAPDLTEGEIAEIVGVALDEKVDGIIATNTTTAREGLESALRSEQGGLSGQPLAVRSTEVIDLICRETGGRLPVIGAGGVRTANDARAKLDAGASLVQMYTGLVYEGPRVAGQILRNLT